MKPTKCPNCHSTINRYILPTENHTRPMLWGMPLTKDIRLVCPHCGKYLARKYGDARFVAMIAAAPFSRVVFDYPVFSVKWNIHLVMVVVLVGMAALDMLANKAFVLSKKNADTP